MKTIWVILSTVAIANMIALAVFLGWLGGTNRLSRERVDSVRRMFLETVADQEVREGDEARDAERQAILAEAERKKGFPPLTADQRLELIGEYADLIAQRTERTRRETQDLIDTLLAQQARLQQDRVRLDEERKAFESMRARVAELEGSEQFQKALKVYQTVKAEIAASMMMELVNANDLEQVTAYLDALPPRTAAKIVTEFEKQSPALAADLVERLRMHGVRVRESGKPEQVADGAG